MREVFMRYLPHIFSPSPTYEADTIVLFAVILTRVRTAQRYYQLSWGYYRGDRIAIYCYNDLSESGHVDVDYLHYTQF